MTEPEFYRDEGSIRQIARHGVIPEEAEQAIRHNNPPDLGAQTVNGEEPFPGLGLTNRRW